LKRPLIYSDDEDDSQRTKYPRTADIDVPLSAATNPDTDDDMDVDVETFRDSVQRSLSATDPEEDSSLPHRARADASKKRRKSVSTKKPQIMYSDDEGSDSHFERDSVEDALLNHDDDDDDDFGLDTPPRRGGTKAKASTAKGKAGKGKAGQSKSTKAKNIKDKERDRDIYMKDERKLAVPPATTATTSRASSAAAQSGPSDLFANEEEGSLDPLLDGSQPVKDPLSQAIPKKRKLPTIKKTKITAGGTGTSTPTTTTQKPPPGVQELSKPSLPTSEQRKQALTGVRDIDLGDSKVYAELFKGVGGIAPRSGLKNAEERRKELDKMRDEARARRAEEGKFTFDLQCQADKIARFEQRLRAENSTVLHPNFLAAKMRDEWELERRNRRPKEEGEA